MDENTSKQTWSVLSISRSLLQVFREGLALEWDAMTEHQRTPLFSMTVPKVTRTAISVEEWGAMLRWTGLPWLGVEAFRHVWGEKTAQWQQLRRMLHQDLRWCSVQGLKRQEEQRQILRVLREAGVRVALHKGDSLARLLGFPCGGRPVSDVDILIQPGQLAFAIEALRQVGCVPDMDENDTAMVSYLKENQHDFPMRHPRWGLIELHARLPQAFVRGWMEPVWRRGTSVEELGETIHRLDVNDTYVILAVHLFHHGWSNSLKWSVDLLSFHEALRVGSDWTPRPYLRGLCGAWVVERAMEAGVAFRVIVVWRTLQRLLQTNEASLWVADLRSRLTVRERWGLWLFEQIPLELWDKDRLGLLSQWAERSEPLPRRLKALVWPAPEKIAKKLEVSVAEGERWRSRAKWLWQRFIGGGEAFVGDGAHVFRPDSPVELQPLIDEYRAPQLFKSK